MHDMLFGNKLNSICIFGQIPVTFFFLKLQLAMLAWNQKSAMAENLLSWLNISITKPRHWRLLPKYYINIYLNECININNHLCYRWHNRQDCCYTKLINPFREISLNNICSGITSFLVNTAIVLYASVNAANDISLGYVHAKCYWFHLLLLCMVSQHFGGRAHMHRAYRRIRCQLDAVGEQKGEVHLCVFFGTGGGFRG